MRFRLHNISEQVKPRPPIGLIVLAATVVTGAIAAYFFARHGLTLAHYDARGHLIVARRLTDSLTPGWLQLGALWLPVPHLLNAIPVMWDWNYRTGFSAVAINLVAMSVGLGALANFVARRTGSTLAAVTAAAIVQLNPAVLYLSRVLSHRGHQKHKLGQLRPRQQPQGSGAAFPALPLVTCDRNV